MTIGMRTNREVRREMTQDRQSLIPGSRTKVLKIGEVIQLDAEWKKFCERAGITIPHIEHEPTMNKEWGNIFYDT